MVRTLMVETIQVASIGGIPDRRFPLLLGRSLAALWPVADAVVVIGLSVLVGLTYHWVAYAQSGIILDYVKVGAAVALFRWILQRPLSTISGRPRSSLRYQLYLWNAAFLCLLAFWFLGKVSGSYSRGTILLFYVSGLPVLIVWQEVWKRFVREGFSAGRLAVRQGLLLGTLAKIDEFRRKYNPAQAGMIISDIVVLPEEALRESPAGQAMIKEAVARAVELVRFSRIDDVLVLLPWAAADAINTCADKLMTVPVSVLLGPEAVFDRFGQCICRDLGPLPC